MPDMGAPLWSVANALQDVSAVTGLTVEVIIANQRGPVGNQSNWLAAWWMSRGIGIDHGQIGRVLNASQQTVSKRVALVERRRGEDAKFAAWTTALWGLHTI